MLASALASLVPLVGQALAAALLAVGTLAATRLADWLKLSADDRVRGYLLAAVEVAVDAAEDTIRRRGAPLGEAARDIVVGDAAAYVLGRTPAAMTRLGLSAEGVRQMVETRLTGRGL